MTREEIIKALNNFCSLIILEGDRIYVENTTPLVWMEIADREITVGRENPRISAEWLLGQDDTLRQRFENIDSIEKIVEVWGVFQEELDLSIDG